MDVKEIISQIKEHPLSLEITFHQSGEESAFSSTLHEIADALFKSAGRGVKLVEGDGKDLVGFPALTFQHEGSGPINYLALPQGHETAPFVEMLNYKAQETTDTGIDQKERLQEVKRSADILVFIASTCPNCPHAVRAASKLALISAAIKVTIIDVEYFPELAERFKIRTVPMTIIDNELLINQAIPVEKLALKILSRGTDGYMEEVFLSQVETGNIELASKRLLDHDQSEKHFLSAWKKSTLSTRMGLLLVAKQAMEQNSEVLNNIVHGLIELLGSNDTSLRGDTADLLGQIGHSDAVKPLEALLKDSNMDIVEIAEEALESIEQKNSD